MLNAVKSRLSLNSEPKLEGAKVQRRPTSYDTPNSQSTRRSYQEYFICLISILVIIAALINQGPYESISPYSDVLVRPLAPPSRFAQLSRGRMHYVVYLPTEIQRKTQKQCERPIVLVHGISVGIHLWEETAPYLSSKVNCPVIVFDLYGRGLSDAVFPNDDQLFSGQIAEFLNVIQHELKDHYTPSSLTTPFDIDLVGVSLGGVVASKFASTFPKSVHSLVLICPAGLKSKVPFTAHIAKLPLLGEILIPLVGFQSMKGHVKDGYIDLNHSANQVEFIFEYLQYQIANHPGFLDSVLSTLRYFPIHDATDTFSRLNEQFSDLDKKTLILWGDKDITTPISNAEDLMVLLKDSASLKVLENCAHADMLATESCFTPLTSLILNHFDLESKQIQRHCIQSHLKM
eukprot:Awhi_evm1s4466